jgi:hypothetical protein
MTPNVAAAKAALAHLDLDQNEAAIKSKSRDFFWYSPVLKRHMDHLVADFVVNPRTQDEVIEVLKVCYAHNVPVTTRGAGTGNYGQAMPLAGGCVMHLRHMNKVKEIHPGRVIAEPGCVIRDLDRETRAHSGQELRMTPSTFATATIGGFVAGGSGGIGSVHMGGAARRRQHHPPARGDDGGRTPRARLPRRRAAPREPCLRHQRDHHRARDAACARLRLGRDVRGLRRLHGERPLRPDLANQDGILCKLITPIEAPIPFDYFQRVKPHVDAGTSVIA